MSVPTVPTEAPVNDSAPVTQADLDAKHEEISKLRAEIAEAKNTTAAIQSQQTLVVEVAQADAEIAQLRAILAEENARLKQAADAEGISGILQNVGNQESLNVTPVADVSVNTDQTDKTDSGSTDQPETVTETSTVPAPPPAASGQPELAFTNEAADAEGTN